MLLYFLFHVREDLQVFTLPIDLERIPLSLYKLSYIEYLGDTLSYVSNFKLLSKEGNHRRHCYLNYIHIVILQAAQKLTSRSFSERVRFFRS